MAHRITFTTKHGASDTVRVFGQPDRDSAAAAILAAFPGSTIKTAEYVESGAPYVWGELDFNRAEISAAGLVSEAIAQACTTIGGAVIFDVDGFTASVVKRGASSVHYDADENYYAVRALNGDVIGAIYASLDCVDANLVD